MEITGLKLDTNGKIEIPKKYSKIRFDIGLSYCAPNSALWLTNEKDLFVIGIEPNKYNFNDIKKKGLFCKQRNIRIKHLQDNFMLLNCAIDNVDNVVEKKFYNMNGDPGTSSLLEPTKNLKYDVREISSVITIPFKFLLEKIPNRFDYVELVKIDAQGKDLDIIKSAGDYIDKIIILNAEINTFSYYKNNSKPSDFLNYMLEKKFTKIIDNNFVKGELVDATFINEKHKKLIKNINYMVL